MDCLVHRGLISDGNSTAKLYRGTRIRVAVRVRVRVIVRVRVRFHQRNLILTLAAWTRNPLRRSSPTRTHRIGLSGQQKVHQESPRRIPFRLSPQPTFLFLRSEEKSPRWSSVAEFNGGTPRRSMLRIKSCPVDFSPPWCTDFQSAADPPSWTFGPALGGFITDK